MLFISILIPFILGSLLVCLVHPKSSIAETVGLSFLVGLFLETLFMITFDACTIAIERLPLLCVNVLFIGLLLFLLWKRGDRLPAPKLALTNVITHLRSLNAVWVLLLVFIVWFEYLNLEKCLFFPTFDRDSLVFFDTVGYVLANEHTYKGLSLFNSNYIPDIRQAGSGIGYAPFVQLSYGYIYLFGAETSKLIPALLHASFLISFYALLTRCIKKTGAAFITFLMMLTPQMLAFSSLSATNVMHAAFASMGTMYGLVWLKSQQKGDLILSAILLAANVWSRYEGILFIMILGIPLFLSLYRQKSIKWFLVWATIAAMPFIFWSIFQQVTDLHNEKAFVIYRLFWDHEKLVTILQSLLDHLFNTANYGWTFYAVPLSLLINVWYVITKRDNLIPLFILLGGVLLYSLILYQIDYSWDPIQNVLAYSAKRFLFCFVPIAWFYASTNQAIRSAWIWVEEKLTFKKSQSVPA